MRAQRESVISLPEVISQRNDDAAGLRGQIAQEDIVRIGADVGGIIVDRYFFPTRAAQLPHGEICHDRG